MKSRSPNLLVIAVRGATEVVAVSRKERRLRNVRGRGSQFELKVRDGNFWCLCGKVVDEAEQRKWS
jgi:hypothetical protein